MSPTQYFHNVANANMCVCIMYLRTVQMTVIVLLYAQQCDQEWNYVAIKIECLYNVALISLYVLRMEMLHTYLLHHIKGKIFYMTFIE